MAYNALNNLIDAYIYANGVQAITGQILNGVLKQMVSQLGSGYHLMGVAGPATAPEQNDYAMAYFAATAGEYVAFGNIILAAGEVAVLLTYGNGSWEKQTIYNVPTGTADLENTANFITNAVTDLVNYYTKEETDTIMANYPTLAALATALADYYTKTEIDGQKAVTDAALADRYTKSETNTKLEDYYKKTETYDKDEVDSIVAALSRQEYIVAWDGLAAPDVSAIPAGVTVTYSGMTYTGTLDASASTVNKIYMVWNGVAYDMYGTSADGGYSWVPMGTTTVDLSQYATKAEIAQLGDDVEYLNDNAVIRDFGLDGNDALSFVDENGECILQAKDGHIRTKEFDSRDAVKEEDIADFIKRDEMDEYVTKDTGLNGTGQLAIVDENGESIVQFKNGHIKTKEFDSSEITNIDNADENREALAIVDESGNSIVRFMDGHIKTKNFDSGDIVSKVSFATIGMDKLSVEGSSTKSGWQIALSPGVANRAYLPNGFECAHWMMSAKFVCSGGVSFVMGKDHERFGAWIEIKLENGQSTYTFYNNGVGQQYSEIVSDSLGFTLAAGEEYTLRLFFNVTTTKILGFEIFGQYNEYFTQTFNNNECNGYGNPFFYSANNCVVKEYALSNQNYYDIKNAKVAVWGHSYVEGDSLGQYRNETFTNLLANELGPTLVMNFGLGGDRWQGVYEKMSNEMDLVANTQYGLLCCGCNDLALSLAEMKAIILQVVEQLERHNIKPIVFTIAPVDLYGTGDWYNQVYVDTNEWIRDNFTYVDMEQVFLTVDATGEWDDSDVRTDLYIADHIHPNRAGHAAIYRRIQMDCPFLF